MARFSAHDTSASPRYGLQITARDSTGSAINCLPHELLEYIFLLVQAGEDCTHAMPLSQACMHWRAVALGSPRCWATLRITVRSSVKLLGETHTRRHALLLELLARSAGALLSVTLVDRYGPMMLPPPGRWVAQDPDPGVQMVHDLFCHAPRIKTLYVETARRVVAESLVKIPRGQFSALERLTLKLHSEAKAVMASPLPVGAALSAPDILRLTTVTGTAGWLAQGSWFAQGLGSVEISKEKPLNQEDLLSIVKSCPSLTRLSAHVLLSSDSAAPHSPVRAPRLWSLTLTAQNAHLGPIWKRLRAPALQVLHLCAFYACEQTARVPWPRPEFAKFLAHSGSALVELALDLALLSADEVKNVLPHLPELTALGPRAVAQVLPQLMRHLADDRARALLPQLRVFELSNAGAA